MATSAIIDGCKDAGQAPGDGVRSTLDGPENLQLFEADADLVDKQLGGRRPTGWKGGRRKGATNRATRDVIEYVRAAGTDPLIWMSKVSSMSMDEVKKNFGFKKKSDAAEFQRKVVKDYRDTLYPGSTIADILTKALGDTGILQVVGFMALAGAKPGDLGAAAPDIEGGKGETEQLSRRPAQIEQKQEVSDVEPD